jgi:hypothetical protein
MIHMSTRVPVFVEAFVTQPSLTRRRRSVRVPRFDQSKCDAVAMRPGRHREVSLKPHEFYFLDPRPVSIEFQAGEKLRGRRFANN